MEVKAVDRITRILLAIGDSKQGLTNAELAKTLDLPKSTLSKILGSLTTHEWLVLDQNTKRYNLGPLNLLLAGRYIDKLELIRIGQRFLRQLKEETGETAAMEVPSGYEMVMVAKDIADDAKLLDAQLISQVARLSELGQRAPLYATAAGKCMLAQRSDEELDQYLKTVKLVPITGGTITDPQRLKEEIQTIRQEGLAYNHQELNPDTIAVAAPVFDLYKRVVAALVVIIPDYRFDEEKKKRVERAVRKAGLDFSKLVGFQHTGLKENTE